MFYAGTFLGCFVLARIPDVKGRRWPYYFCILVQLPCYFGIIFSTNLDLTIGLSFILGFVHTGIYNGGYVNVCEYVNNPWKNYVCTILLVFDMLVTILNGIYYHYITNYWFWFVLIGGVFNIIAAITIVLIPESPEYLYSFYRFQECKDILFLIAKWNSTHNY